jgi:CheY-like chemotaxis protein
MAIHPDRTVILVVEDEPFIRMVAVDLLSDRGRVVLEAGCVEEALAINMPGELDGLDLASIASRRQPDLKLIVTSGAKKLADDQIPDHGVFIPKPYSTRDLAYLVEAKLTESR